MMSPVESVVTCCQLTGLAVFYTFFFAAIWAFDLSLPAALYSAALGAVLIFLTADFPFEKWEMEPKGLLVGGLSSMSLCSAALATCMFVETDAEVKPSMLRVLPKISIVLFYISFYLTRTATLVYAKAVSRQKTGTGGDATPVFSWMVTCILFGFKCIGYEDYTKSLAGCMIAFSFLFLSLAFFTYDRIPLAHGLFEHELAQEFGFETMRSVLRHDEHRSFTSSDGVVTHFVRNLTNEKVAIQIIFSNPEDELVQQPFRFIRSRGHLRIQVRRSATPTENDRCFVMFSKELTEPFTSSGFLTIRF